MTVINGRKAFRDKQRKELVEVMNKFMAYDDDAVAVLYVNGVRTNNNYPYWALFERDAKSPIDWINGILLSQDMQNKQDVLEIRIEHQKKQSLAEMCGIK